MTPRLWMGRHFFNHFGHGEGRKVPAEAEEHLNQKPIHRGKEIRHPVDKTRQRDQSATKPPSKDWRERAETESATARAKETATGKRHSHNRSRPEPNVGGTVLQRVKTENFHKLRRLRNHGLRLPRRHRRAGQQHIRFLPLGFVRSERSRQQRQILRARCERMGLVTVTATTGNSANRAVSTALR